MPPTADDAVDDFAMLGLSKPELAEGVVVPTVESLFALEQDMSEFKPEHEFWRWVAIEAAKDICLDLFNYAGNVTWTSIQALRQRRSEYERTGREFKHADAIVCGEINCFVNRVFNPGGDEVIAKTKPAPTSKIDEIKDAEQFAALKRNGKSRPATAPPLPATVQIIPLRNIVDSPFQTREEPSDESIAELARSLGKDGQRDPIRVREVGSKYELIAGHRRTRAARHLNWETINAVIIVADDAKASFEVYDDNRQREDLNCIERAKGLKLIWEQYQAAGKTMDQMAEDVGLDQSTISNRIRVLAAPESLQKRLISGEITESRMRTLAKWAKYDGILPRFEKELEMRCHTGPVSDNHWYASLRIAVRAYSKPIKSNGWGEAGPLFKIAAHETELDIVDIKFPGENADRRAMNVKLWTKLNNEAKKLKAAKEEKKATATKENPTVARTNTQSYPFSNAMQTAWHERLWCEIGTNLTNPKLTRPQKAIAARMIHAMDWNVDEDWIIKSQTLSEAEYVDACIAMIASEWMDGMHWNISIDLLQQLATMYGIDIVSEWKPTEVLLQACEEIDLKEFAAELQVTSTTRDELIRELLAKWTPGWIPDLFAIEKPKAKPKKKSKFPAF